MYLLIDFKIVYNYYTNGTLICEVNGCLRRQTFVEMFHDV